MRQVIRFVWSWFSSMINSLLLKLKFSYAKSECFYWEKKKKSWLCNTVSILNYYITNNYSVTMQDIFFCVLDATEGLLRGVRNMLENIFIPAILATNNWGVLSQNKQDTKDKQNFVESIRRYLSFLQGKLCI